MKPLPEPRLPDECRSRMLGCMLGGAVGDALGAPIEFQTHAQIIANHGDGGVRDMLPAYGRRGAVTDDTQMALFTAEGVLRGHIQTCLGEPSHRTSELAAAYLRWLCTQGIPHVLHQDVLNGWLVGIPALHARRAPGSTCLTALQQMRSLDQVVAANTSKGCGGVMRVAPIGMYLAALCRNEDLHLSVARAFELGCDAAAITHGHPTGQLSAGAFASLLLCLLSGHSLMVAITATLARLQSLPGHEETLAALHHAIDVASSSNFCHQRLRELGEGWVAEEALAIGLYCALTAPDFETGVINAVNHDGDSDSTGLIAGHLLGALHGHVSIPERWLLTLELRAVLEQIASDLASCTQWLEPLGHDELKAALVRYPAACPSGCRFGQLGNGYLVSASLRP